MKTTGGGAGTLCLTILGFFMGLGVSLFGFVKDGGAWAMQPFNKYASGDSQLTTAGDVLNHSGVVLAKNEGDKRAYGSNGAVRRVTLRAVGDTNGYISTGAQYRYRSEIGGYNLIAGLTPPTGKKQGSDITLMPSSELSKPAYNKLDGRRGAVAIYNYKTGEMLVMVNTPNFDPSNVPKDIDTNSEYEETYLNKVSPTSYMSGSIFKIVMTAAVTEALPDWNTKIFVCKDSITINGNEITCDGVHGTINIKQTLAKSCNMAFAQPAVELGEKKMTAEANTVGFNRSFPVDGIDILKSRYGVKGTERQVLVWSGIGQHTDMMNPYHMTLLMDVAANDGTSVQPYFIRQIKNSLGITQQQGKAGLGTQFVKPIIAQTFGQLMCNNVVSDYDDDMSPGMSTCAKTDTAEVGGGKKSNGWMIGFLSDPTASYVFVVVAERGDYGRTSAGSIAKTIMTQTKKLGL